MNVVIYARFSSHNQTEQSIEGQLKVCREYAERNNYTIIDIYKDEARSGTKDNRSDFQRMIEDSNKKLFQGILVYQLDRFARNKYDSVVYKRKLKKNGVRVLSAKENISDDASGILMESVLEGMAEYYSVELGQKVVRGMGINAEKCYYNGGPIPLGYKVKEIDEKSKNNKKKKVFEIDESTAYIVKNIFDMYNNGKTMEQISNYLNSKGIKTRKGNSYKKNSISVILKNRRYTGIYIYKDIEKVGGIPKIIEEDVFNEVQEKLAKMKIAPAKSKAKDEYLLTTKLFCGHCKEMMTGTSGTSHTKKVYKYYVCNGIKKKKCNKTKVHKESMEHLVVAEARKILTNRNIAKISKNVVELCEKDINATKLKQLNGELKNNERRKDNLLNAVMECGEENIRNSLYEKIKELDMARVNIEKEIIVEERNHIKVTEDEITFFLTQLRKGNINDVKYRKMFIDTLIDKIYLYDDRMTIVFTTQNKKVELDKKILEEAESSYLKRNAEP